MPFRTTFSPIRVRRVLAAAAVVLLVCAIVAGRFLGRWLVVDEPVTQADAVFVLAGAPAERIVEGGDLVVAGLAPRIVVSGAIRDGGEIELERRGIPMPVTGALQRDALVRMGVPAGAIVLLPPRHNSTGDEAATLAALIREHGWRRVIVVTSKYHTRRSGFVIRRAVAATGVTIIMRASRYDQSNPDRWWSEHSDRRFVFFEVQKLIAYALGVN